MSNSKINIPLISWWSIAITMIFVICRIFNIIEWDIIWILSPLWIPTAIALTITILIGLFILFSYLTLFILAKLKII